MKLGIIDIGTNSVHMILVDVSKDFRIEVIDRAKEFTQLGDTSFQKGLLSEQAIERGLSAVKKFKKLATIHGVQKIKAVATSAVREAQNGGDFLEMIHRETGIKVRVITGEEEGRLIYLAVKHSIPLAKEPYLIVDIGGGSVELVAANEKGILHCASLKLGTLRLKGEFLTKDPASSRELEKMSKAVVSALKTTLAKVKSYKIRTVIGTSGTILSLVSIAHWKEWNEPIKMRNHYQIAASKIIAQHEGLIRADRKTRLKIRGLDEPRVDLIIPGSMVLVTLLKKLGIQKIFLCDEAIREGVIYDYLDRNKGKIEMESLVPDLRRRSILQLARKCDAQEKHSQHVTQLALSLFDQLRSLHKLGVRERELLEFATLLHDIGPHINFKKHHRHAYYIIKNSDMNGFQEKEIELMANLVRYQTKAGPKKSHENWSSLSTQDQHLVRVGSSIIRLANALDRTRFSVVKNINVTVSGKKMILDIKAHGDAELELWTAQKEKDSLENVFEKEIVFLVNHKRKTYASLSRTA